MVLNSCPVKKENVAFRVIADSAIIIRTDDLGKVVYHSLNEAATRIWELIDTRITIREIISQIVVEFSVDEKTAKKDCLEFIQLLWENNLISFVQNKLI